MARAWYALGAAGALWCLPRAAGYDRRADATFVTANDEVVPTAVLSMRRHTHHVLRGGAADPTARMDISTMRVLQDTLYTRLIHRHDASPQERDMWRRAIHRLSQAVRHKEHQARVAAQRRKAQRQRARAGTPAQFVVEPRVDAELWAQQRLTDTWRQHLHAQAKTASLPTAASALPLPHAAEELPQGALSLAETVNMARVLASRGADAIKSVVPNTLKHLLARHEHDIMSVALLAEKVARVQRDVLAYSYAMQQSGAVWAELVGSVLPRDEVAAMMRMWDYVASGLQDMMNVLKQRQRLPTRAVVLMDLVLSEIQAQVVPPLKAMTARALHIVRHRTSHGRLDVVALHNDVAALAQSLQRLHALQRSADMSLVTVSIVRRAGHTALDGVWRMWNRNIAPFLLFGMASLTNAFGGMLVRASEGHIGAYLKWLGGGHEGLFNQALGLLNSKSYTIEGLKQALRDDLVQYARHMWQADLYPGDGAVNAMRTTLAGASTAVATAWRAARSDPTDENKKNLAAMLEALRAQTAAMPADIGTFQSWWIRLKQWAVASINPTHKVLQPQVPITNDTAIYDMTQKAELWEQLKANPAVITAAKDLPVKHINEVARVSGPFTGERQGWLLQILTWPMKLATFLTDKLFDLVDWSGASQWDLPLPGWASQISHQVLRSFVWQTALALIIFAIKPLSRQLWRLWKLLHKTLFGSSTLPRELWQCDAGVCRAVLSARKTLGATYTSREACHRACSSPWP